MSGAPGPGYAPAVGSLLGGDVPGAHRYHSRMKLTERELIERLHPIIEARLSSDLSTLDHDLIVRSLTEVYPGQRAVVEEALRTVTGANVVVVDEPREALIFAALACRRHPIPDGRGLFLCENNESGRGPAELRQRGALLEGDPPLPVGFRGSGWPEKPARFVIHRESGRRWLREGTVTALVEVQEGPGHHREIERARHNVDPEWGPNTEVGREDVGNGAGAVLIVTVVHPDGHGVAQHVIDTCSNRWQGFLFELHRHA